MMWRLTASNSLPIALLRTAPTTASISALVGLYSTQYYFHCKSHASLHETFRNCPTDDTAPRRSIRRTTEQQAQSRRTAIFSLRLLNFAHTLCAERGSQRDFSLGRRRRAVFCGSRRQCRATRIPRVLFSRRARARLRGHLWLYRPVTAARNATHIKRPRAPDLCCVARAYISYARLLVESQHLPSS